MKTYIWGAVVIVAVALVGLTGLGLIAATNDSESHSPCTQEQRDEWAERGITVDAPYSTCEELK